MPAIAGNFSDLSGVVAAGPAAVQIATRNVGRQYLAIQNLDATDELFVGFDEDVAREPGYFVIPARGLMEWSANGTGAVPTGEVWINGSAGQEFTAKEA